MTDREEFEAWMKSLSGYPFAGQFANLMWAAWQAARATAEQREPSAIREIWMAEVCQDEDGFKHIESVVEDLDDFAAGTRLYVLDSSKKHDLIDDDLIAKLALEVSTECLAVPGVNFYMAAEMAIELTIETLGALKSQQDAAIPFRPWYQILDELKTNPKLLADIEQAVEASKASIAQLERERTVTREQLNTPLCQAAGDYDVEALMDRWGIPSHLRDRFRDPMRKLVVCKKQDAAIESKPAEQQSLGDVTGAMYRCRRCGESSEIQFNFATLPKEEPCCRQRPCVRSGTGPCDMPARDTKLSATHQSLLVRLAALKRYRNKLKSTGEPSGNYATLSVPIVLLEAIDAAIESQRSGKSNG